MEERLISHGHSVVDFDDLLRAVRNRIESAGEKAHVSVDRQLGLLDELRQFELGHYLLKNKGVNGYWIHRVLLHPSEPQKKLTDLERYFFERAPLTLATQERFQIFLAEIQKSVKSGACLASIPSGILGELLYLDLEGVEGVRLVGIDYDPETLVQAKELAVERGLENCVELHEADAWQLGRESEFDLISSNGLNIYEPDDAKVVELYQQFYKALKPGGKLVTSFVTPPPTLTDQCEWKLDRINPADLLHQRILYTDIIEANWQCFRSSAQTQAQLEEAGFVDIHFICDRAHLYPTVMAVKE